MWNRVSIVHGLFKHFILQIDHHEALRNWKWTNKFIVEILWIICTIYSIIGSISFFMIKVMCGFLHFAPLVMTFYVITLCWPLGTAQYKVVQIIIMWQHVSHYIVPCNRQRLSLVLSWHIAIQSVYRWQHNQMLKSMRCDSVFVCEGFCTNRNPSPLGVGVWSIWNIIGEVVCVVPCFQQWQDMMMSDADAQLCTLHIIFVLYLCPSHRGGCIKITDITWEIDKQLECAQHCPEPTGLQQSAHMLCTKEHEWSLSLSHGTVMNSTHSAHQGELLLQCKLTGHEMCQSCGTWNQKSIHDVEKPVTSVLISNQPISKEDHDNCLFGTIKVCIF